MRWIRQAAVEKRKREKKATLQNNRWRKEIIETARHTANEMNWWIERDPQTLSLWIEHVAWSNVCVFYSIEFFILFPFFSSCCKLFKIQMHAWKKRHHIYIWIYFKFHTFVTADSAKERKKSSSLSEVAEVSELRCRQM